MVATIILAMTTRTLTLGLLRNLWQT
uniref:Uncharacterized protein n=1 Tax=Arundo donax TaxID=35708 RepID=A0A0A9DU21_ARUDO